MLDLLIEVHQLPPRKLRSACRRIGLSDLDIAIYCIREANNVIKAAFGRNSGKDEQVFTDGEAERLALMMGHVAAVREFTKDGEAYDECVRFLEYVAQALYGGPGTQINDARRELMAHPPRPKKDRSWSPGFRRRYEKLRSTQVVFVDA